MAREQVLKFNHQQNVIEERLIGERHVSYDSEVITTTDSSFEKNWLT